MFTYVIQAALHVMPALLSVCSPIRARNCKMKQENRAVARKPRDTAAVLFGSKFADNIHYKFRSSQASKARLQSSKRTGARQNLMQNDHSRSHMFWSQWKGDKGVKGTK